MSICQACTPSTVTGWPVYCTLAPGHTGDHQALGVTGAVLEQWQRLTSM